MAIGTGSRRNGDDEERKADTRGDCNMDTSKSAGYDNKFVILRREDGYWLKMEGQTLIDGEKEKRMKLKDSRVTSCMPCIGEQLLEISSVFHAPVTSLSKEKKSKRSLAKDELLFVGTGRGLMCRLPRGMSWITLPRVVMGQ